MSAPPVTAGPAGADPGTGAPNLRAPALSVAFALAAGILCDRAWNVAWPFWEAGAAALTVMAVWTARSPRITTCCLALLWVCLGGAWHHGAWSVRRTDHVARYATNQPQPVELIARVATAVEFRPPEDDPSTPSWMRMTRSVCTVDAESLFVAGTEVDVSGRVRVEVTGHLLHVRVGDRVRIVGRMVLPGEPDNPGGFDFQAYLRVQAVDCLVRSNHPDVVTVLPERAGWSERVARVRHSLREECLLILKRELSPEHVPLAASLLLGDRTEVTQELRTAFAESGTMHLLAISGLHVGILAALVFLACRLLNSGPAGTATTVLLIVWLYAFVTDHRPPVLRASVLVTIMVVGSLLTRVVNSINALALAAIVVLLWSPAALFDVGAQLSFLAVVAILWSVRLESEWFHTALPPDPLRPEAGRIQRLTGPLLRGLRSGYLMTFSIWLFTLPLVMARFHLASPIGFCLNVVLIPFVAFTLASGFLLLLCGMLLPFLTPVPGFVFDNCLGLLLWIAEGAAGWRGGHVYVGGPPDWWLIVFYALLAVATRLFAVPSQARRAWQLLAVWIILGLVAGLLPPRRDGLTCTFLSVGHGCGILVECPNGRTLLYDAGTFGSGYWAQQTIQEALWARGLHKLDVIVISHADVDHFNGVAGLLETVPIDQILISRPFLDFDQGSVVAVCEAAAEHGVDIALIQTGDQLRMDPDVELRVLHPPDGFAGQSDNENSIVLQIGYAGRLILLTGDLEGAGLAELLSTPPRDMDVLLSPHHGSRAANPPELDDWARPEYVMISTGDFGVAERLTAVYGDDCRVLSTAESGAVTVRVSSAGELKIQEFFAASD